MGDSLLPTVFLSLSGVDEDFVSRVQEDLPDGQAHFYPKSFENGERLLDAMEERVADVEIFALFASKASIDSCWVQFEIDRARLAKIRRPGLRCLVFPIDRDVTYSSLPSWMQEYWIGTAGQSARDIARYIRGVLRGLALTSETALHPVGRGALVDKTRREFHAAGLISKKTPNIFVFAGHAGIGRRTVQDLFLSTAFPALPEATFGPVLDLPQFADLSDVYRAARREVEDHFSLKSFQHDLPIFLSKHLEEQVDEIIASLVHFAELGQAVTIVTGNGIYEDRGVIKPWVPILFEKLEDCPKLKTVIISNRMLHENELRPHSNVIQFYVDPLGDEDIKTLILASIPIFGGKPVLPSDFVIRAIGGHPTVARSVARLVAKKGPLSLDDNPKQIFDIQEQILSESLNFDNLTDIERDILSILSWIPQFSATMLRDIIIEVRGVDRENFAITMDNLMLGCLVQISGTNYLISAPIRGMFRRKHGYGSTELRSLFAKKLKSAWDEAVENDELKTELFDAFVYMIALEDGSLPKEFADLLLPSTLQDVVREAYDRRHSDDAALARVITWGSPAKNMRMDEGTREEILSYVLRAEVRLNRIDEARSTLKFMQSKGYRSVFYLEAFLLRLGGGNLRDAVDLLKNARPIKKYINSVIADLGICLKLLGRWSDLEKLLSEEARRVEKSPILLDIKIGMLVAAGNFKEAEREIGRLRGMAHDDGRADSRTATIIMNRDRDFGRAEALLTTVLNRRTRGAQGVRRLRALAAARGGNFEVARRDSEYLRQRPGGHDTYFRLEAEIKMAQKDYRGAIHAHSEIKASTAQDRLLKARILESEGTDPKTPLARRDTLMDEASLIRIQNKAVDEYDFDF